MARISNEQAGNLVRESGEAALHHTRRYSIVSRGERREYRISVAMPVQEPPPSGFPVIYLLDANAVFATMVEAVRVQSRRPEKTGVVPAIVVGIGYRTEEPFAPERYYDFTLPVPIEELPAKPDGTPWPEQGGADAFLTFIEEDLKPQIAQSYPVDSGRQTIFGHSLGGLFVLHTLFTRPEAFQTYIAGSPSIHWNRRCILEEERQFPEKLEQIHSPGQRNVDVLIAVGELEGRHPSGMNGNAMEMAQRLASLANRGVRAEFKQFEDEGHVSVLPVLISRALRFALRP
ncbi:alpha/beta hydrolase [Paenibacillus doosanensis]|uniref:Ferri-bacillibactin esterase BesA n=1 Tax=Paenibacillus konkukensis TaxID=2020716 RepID=A0ABY4RNP6_9BACL|nr:MULTISPECIES: alpha/beta hydrolase [Paenibacillus]MCS7463020.1 alpha/beta hydrolase [Paenibacillus doosanensis]UQZ83054.1 Ferri-bacillibactin esterase BesA [Paenibacillus konkukensis]